MKAQAVTDIGIAVLATIFLFTCWGREGWLFQAGLVWAGMSIGYIVTVYLNKEEE